jgi:hypothetical protein
MTCLLARAARALKYSRRLVRGVAASASGFSESNLGTVWVRWTCRMC